VKWLHDAGYTFTGDDGVYALSYPEMRVLYSGYQIAKEEREMNAKGVSRGDRAAFSEYSQQLEEGSWREKHS